MTSDDLISMHKATVDVVADMTEALISLEAGAPADDMALAVCLADLATGVRACATVQRDMLAAMLA
jgi:hypothetical protein